MIAEYNTWGYRFKMAYFIKLTQKNSIYPNLVFKTPVAI